MTTWGGADYNMLLAHTLSKALGLSELASDAQGISGLDSRAEITPRIAFDSAVKLRDSGGLPAKLAAKFRAVSWEGMLIWLTECDSLGNATS